MSKHLFIVMVEKGMEIWRVSIDFGLVILIWMTQLIVYPSFTYFQPADLEKWHIKYTPKITLIVAPLMFGQVGILLWQFFYAFNWSVVASGVLVATVWINTFFYAVPLHEQITKKEDMLPSARKLVKVNWYRTAVWTIVWVLGLIDWYY